jgi:hypothetical protein
MVVFWYVAPCSLVDSEIITLMMEAKRSFETSVNIYQIISFNISEGSHLQL